MMNDNTKVLLIYTGGTIGMMEDIETTNLRPFDFKHLLDEVPELRKLELEVKVKETTSIIDSSNASPKIWMELLELIKANYDLYDGFVVLHGSDTMAYTASAISFLIENSNKPIIFTGSQLPIGKLRTDGKENLITAIEIAGAKENGRSIISEVAIYFEYNLYRANRTSKVSAENFEAFQSPNYPVLAEAGVNIKYNRFALKKPNEERVHFRNRISEDVASLKLFPGIRKEVFQAVSRINELKGLVIETYGSGNAPMLTWLDEELRQLDEKGVLVLNVSQCLTGSVSQAKYETGQHLQNNNVIGGYDITFESAITKMMYLLACNDLSHEEKRNYLQTNIRGEITL